MTQDNAFISFRNVNKFFGQFQAINDVSINIDHGEFFSLLGPSGCGKTTLLNSMINYIMGIKQCDKFRYLLIDEPEVGGS